MLSAGGIRSQFSLARNVELSVFGAEWLRGGLRDALAASGCVDEANDSAARLRFVEAGYLTLASEVGANALRKNHVVAENNKTNAFFPKAPTQPTANVKRRTSTGGPSRGGRVRSGGASERERESVFLS